MLFQSFEDSDAWKIAHEFTLAVYRVSSHFPKAEVYGLTSQMRRSASSVPANLAEEMGRHSKRELLRYCRIANGSLHETKYFALLAKDLNYCEPNGYQEITTLAKRVGALIGGLERSLQKQTATR